MQNTNTNEPNDDRQKIILESARWGAASGLILSFGIYAVELCSKTPAFSLGLHTLVIANPVVMGVAATIIGLCVGYMAGKLIIESLYAIGRFDEWLYARRIARGHAHFRDLASKTLSKRQRGGEPGP